MALTPRDSHLQRAIRSGYTGPKNNRGEPDTTGSDEIGVMNYPDDAAYLFKHYSGQWKNGEFDGQGAVIMRCGDTYTGEFRAGESHGRGVYTHSNGIVRDGEFVDDRHVSGTVIRPDYTFQGTFVKEQPRTGTITSNSDGSVFIGTIESATKRVGTQRYPDGDIFSGTFEFQKRGGWILNGDDAIIIVKSMPIKFRYQGQARNGVRHGRGTMEIRSGPQTGETYSAMFNMDKEDEASIKPLPKQGGTRHNRTRCRRKRLRLSKREKKRSESR